MRYTLSTLTFAIAATCTLNAQTPKNKPVNLVVNPGFEEQTADYKAEITETAPIEAAKGWSSPNLGQPEIFGTTSEGHIYDSYGASWGFKARGGKHVGGLNVHGSREYLQGNLSQPLTVGKKYHFWFYVHYHCSGANNIGITFLPQQTTLTTDGVLPLKPAASQKALTKYSSTQTWTLVRDSFIAYEPYQYFIIGNFAKDEDTQLEGLIDHYFAYIDDVAVIESRDQVTGMPAATDVEKKKAEWADNTKTVAQIKANPSFDISKAKADETLQLPNVLFKVGTDELLDSSYDALDNIIAQMKRNNSINIQIIGHTSTEGTAAFNQRLSEQRANAVKKALVDKGIADNRVTAVGKGETQPLVPGNDEEARTKNRRVEFKVVN